MTAGCPRPVASGSSTSVVPSKLENSNALRSEVLVQPMGPAPQGCLEELFRADVDRAVKETKGTLLVAVNLSAVARPARPDPASPLPMESEVKPDRMITVFAGQDLEATARAHLLRRYMPSSPQVALLKDGRVVYMMERTTSR